MCIRDRYHHGDFNAFHVSYFRRKAEEERAFHVCNLRKSYGFHLVAQGADPLPSVEDVRPPYHIEVIKYDEFVCFKIQGLTLFEYQDDGLLGPVLKGGYIGFRPVSYTHLNLMSCRKHHVIFATIIRKILTLIRLRKMWELVTAVCEESYWKNLESTLWIISIL